MAELSKNPSILANLAPTIDRAVTFASARRLWNATHEIKGTIAERYLKARGINMARWLSALRFHINVFHHRDKKADYFFPALIACAEIDRRFAGVHRTWLDPTTPDFKIDFEPRKAALGTRAGAAVSLTPYQSSEVVLVEGIEDGLSLLQANPELTVWVALGSNLQGVQLPDFVTTVIVGGDNDSPGRKAAYTAVREFRRQGRIVRTVFPAIGIKDFNEQLQSAHV
jgi:DNA primase